MNSVIIDSKNELLYTKNLHARVFARILVCTFILGDRLKSCYSLTIEGMETTKKFAVSQTFNDLLPNKIPYCIRTLFYRLNSSGFKRRKKEACSIFLVVGCGVISIRLLMRFLELKCIILKLRL